MKQSFLVIIVLFVFTINTYGQTRDRYVCFEKLKTASKNKDRSSQLVYSLQYINIVPQSTSGYHYYGVVNAYQELYWNAIDSYSKLLKLNPDADYTLFNRALSYGAVGYDSLAIADLSKILEKDPGNASAYISRSANYLKLGDFDNFFKDSRKVISLNDYQTYAYMNIAEVYRGRQQFDSAYFYLSKTIELDPDFAEAYSNRASVAFDLQYSFEEIKADAAKALNIFKKRLKENPHNSSIRYQIADAYMVLNEKEKAQKIIIKLIPQLNKQIELYTDAYLLFYKRGMAYKMLGREAEAMADMRKAMEINPECPFMQWSLDLEEYEKKLKAKK